MPTGVQSQVPVNTPPPVAASSPPQASALAVFQEQYRNMFSAEEFLVFSKKKAQERSDKFLQKMPRILSVYEHDGELYPLVSGPEAEEILNPFKYGGDESGNLGERIFVRFCIRTGKAAIIGNCERLKEVTEPLNSFPGGKFPSFGGFLLTCTQDSCRADLTALQKKWTTTFKCPRCGSKEALLVFHVPPLDLPSVMPRPDGIFRSIKIEKNGLVFQKNGMRGGLKVPPGEFLFAEAGLVYAGFIIGAAPPMKISRLGKIAIEIYDKKAVPVVRYESGDLVPYTFESFQSFLVTLSQAGSDVRIYASVF